MISEYKSHNSKPTDSDVMPRITRNQFASLCEEIGVHPAIAIEHEPISDALRAHKTYDELREILANEF